MSRIINFNKLGKTASLALMTTTALSSMSGYVAAQDDEAVLEEIMVTATRRSTTVQDVPYNISAVSGSAIEQAQMVDAAELLRSMAGVAVNDTGMRNAGVVSTIKIRGLNVDSSGRGDYAVTASPTVASYINDTPLFAGVMLKDLNRVEVLRGPQGTLYGAGALGGAVRYITNKPQLGEFSGKIKGSFSKSKGSEGQNFTGDLVLNVPMGETFALRLVGSRVDNDGIIDYRNVYVRDANGAPSAPDGVGVATGEYEVIEDADYGKSWFFRGSALFEPSEAFNATFSYTRQSDDTGGRRASAEGYSDGWGNPYGRYEAGSVQVESSEAEVEMASLEMNIDLGFATLTSSTSMFETTGTSISENTGFYANAGWLRWYYNPGRPLAVPVRGYGTEAFVQEARLVSNNDGPLNWVGGVYYQDHDNIATQQSFLPGSKAFGEADCGCSLPWVNDLEQDWDYAATTTSKELALFGEVTYDISDNLHINAGLRWFDSEVTSDVHMALPYWPPGDVVDVVESKKESGTLFKFNASYDLNDDNMMYATFSQGYRRGGANAVPLVGWYGEDDAWFSYGSDKVDNFELGIKGKNETMTYTVSAFYMDWTDPQLNTSSPNGGFFVVANSGGSGNKYDLDPSKASTKGIEVELTARMTDDLKATFGYSYVEAKLSSDLIAQHGGVVAPEGNPLPGVPKHMLNIALDYQTSVTSDIMFYGRLDGYVQSSMQNSINSAADSAKYGDTLDGFGLWNMSGTFAWDNIDLTLYMKNMFNSMGVTGHRKGEWGGARPDLNYYGSGANRDIALPRTIGVAVSYSF